MYDSRGMLVWVSCVVFVVDDCAVWCDREGGVNEGPTSLRRRLGTTRPTSRTAYRYGSPLPFPLPLPSASRPLCRTTCMTTCAAALVWRPARNPHAQAFGGGHLRSCTVSAWAGRLGASLPRMEFRVAECGHGRRSRPPARGPPRGAPHLERERGTDRFAKRSPPQHGLVAGQVPTHCPDSALPRLPRRSCPELTLPLKGAAADTMAKSEVNSCRRLRRLRRLRQRVSLHRRSHTAGRWVSGRSRAVRFNSVSRAKSPSPSNRSSITLQL